MHRRIKHGLAVRSGLPFLPLPPGTYSRCLSLPRPALSLPLRVSVDFSAPYPSPRVLAPLPFLLFRHLTLTHPSQTSIFFFFLFLFFPLLDISLRLVLSHLRNRRA